MVRFIDVYERLPSSAPVGHPHIVDRSNEETDKDNLRVADGICTMLYKYNPSVLRDFLNLQIPVIEILRREQEGSSRYNLLIARHERVVTLLILVIQCGFMRDGEFVDVLVDFGITHEGLWVPLTGHTDMIHPTGPNKAEILDDFGTQFASQIVYWELWEESTAKEIKVSIERNRPDDDYEDE
ncbi:MAG: hypothetical protein Q9174_003151 [Haloplaca sp. 1 TL-2023]